MNDNKWLRMVMKMVMKIVIGCYLYVPLLVINHR
jgi:hypothetical protein